RPPRMHHPPADRPGTAAHKPARVPPQRRDRAGDGVQQPRRTGCAGIRLRARAFRFHAWRHARRVDRDKVRMYKKLLGDCFLIILEGKNGTSDAAAHILIDCGVLQGTRGTKALMTSAVQNIYETAGEKGLDLVVVTHEHYDHICGFQMASEIF